MHFDILSLIIGVVVGLLAGTALAKLDIFRGKTGK